MKYKTLFDLWKQSCSKYSENILFSDNKTEETLTYKQAFREVCFLASKFKDFKLERLDHVALFSRNCPRWLVLEQAVITLGCVCVSKSSEVGFEELNYVFNNSDSCALITDKIELIEFLKEKNENLLKNVKFILYIGHHETASDETISKIKKKTDKIYFLEDILQELTQESKIKTDWEENPDDIAYINYTSGTSSMPKGAMLANVSMAYVTEQLQLFNEIEPQKTFVVTFPLSSAGGKSFNLLCLSKGCRIMYTTYKEYYDVLLKYQPDYLHCAPKIMQTIHEKFMAQVRMKGFFFEKLYSASFNISKLILHIERKYFYNNRFRFLKRFSDTVKQILDKNIYKQIRNTLLKDEAVVYVGSAHLAKPLEDYFEITGVKLVQHYGLTETTGLDISNTLETQKTHPYTVGIPFEQTTVKIIDPETKEEVKQGEVGLIMLQGPEILKGYYKNPEATQKALTEDNYLNTGDLGFKDKDGYLVVLSRYDDVIVLSNGYNIYTPLLENQVKDSEYIQQIVIAGHGKPYLTALIVLNKEEYANRCKAKGTKIIDPNNDIEFKTFLLEHLNEKLKGKNDYKYYEKLKKIYFLKEGFTEGNGLLTGTLKVKYKKVCTVYKDLIEKLYEEK